MQKLLDFDVVIEQHEDGYRTRVLASPAGQAQASFLPPFTEKDLELLILRVTGSIGRARRQVRRIETQERRQLEEFGSQLFRALFSGSVAECLGRSRIAAESRNAGLRVRLRLPGSLANIPWEYLHDEEYGFLGMSPETALVRYVEMPTPVRPFPVSPPLRILAMISAPSDVPGLEAEQEWSKLRESLGDLIERGMVEVDRLGTGTLAALQRPLRLNRYHVLHFVGHGVYDEGAEDGALALEGPGGKHRLVTGRDLGVMLRGHRSLRLVVLNACEGARSARDDPFGGVAQALVRQGIPAVIAMQFEISDPAAVVFSQSFYQAIADGLPVDMAMVEARIAMFAEGNEVEWATPVLYLRSPDGRIFTRARIGQDAFRAREETGRQARGKAERQAREKAEQQAREEADRKARQEAEQKIREEAARKSRERRARLKAEQQAREKAEQAREKAEQQARQDAEQRAREKAEQQARQDADRQAREQAERTAQKVPMQLVDGLQGGPAQETLRFGIDGADYEIDLNSGNAERFRRKISHYIDHARRTQQQAKRTAREQAKRTAREETERTAQAEAERKKDNQPATDRATTQTSKAGGSPRLVYVLSDPQGFPGRVTDVAFSPDGRLLASGDIYRKVWLWNPATGKHLRTLTGHHWVDGIQSVAFNVDGRLLASGGDDNRVRLWDPATGRHLRSLAGHTNSVSGMDFSPDGRLLASCGDLTVRLWDPATGKHLRTLTGHTGRVWSVAYAPDGASLASAGGDGSVRLWNPATGKHLRTLTGHTSAVKGAAFSPDGSLLASSSLDETARLWDPATGKHLHTLTGHTGAVNRVAFSPDGSLLASSSDDKTARLWDPATGKHLHTLTGHTASVSAVAFSPDGRLLASSDRTVRLWAPGRQ
jgi:hypothetical protein